MNSVSRKWNDDRLIEAVEKYNAMAHGLSKAAPRVAKALDGATITGNKVDKRTRDKVAAIVAEDMPRDTWARCFLDTGYEYTVYLRTDFNSPVNDTSVAYAEMTVAVAEKDGETWKALEMATPSKVTLAGVRKAIEKAEKASEAVRVAQSKASDAASKARPFIA